MHEVRVILVATMKISICTQRYLDADSYLCTKRYLKLILLIMYMNDILIMRKLMEGIQALN